MRSASGDAQGESAARIAAVICTRNRASLLSRTLESLANQTLEKSAYEVVVIDDGSIDDTRHVAGAFAARVPLRYVYERSAGLASAKNLGLFSTVSPLVAFLDDDDVAAPDMLEEHVRSHERFAGANYGVLGRTRLDAGLVSDPLMHFVTEVGCFLFSYPGLKDGDVLDYSYFWGGRSSCKRSFLLDHGVFNPVFRFGCEDIELGFRLSRHEFRVVYNARALSAMARKVTVDGFCDRLVQQGRSNFVFSQLHTDPEVQRWTEVAGAEEEWREVGDSYDILIRSARRLDRLASLKRELGFDLSESDREWLHRSYWAAFRAAKLKGIHEGRMATSSRRPEPR